MADLPDWTRAVLLQGHDAAGNVVTILVGDDGQLYALLAAQDGTGTVRAVKCDTNGQLVIVPRGAEGNYLSVSADGFLTAVLKGQRDGVLTTIGVDDEGRIEAFILDDEGQWGSVIKIGSAELAARLGSVKAWDWRGKVVRLGDFVGGYQGLGRSTGGAGAAVGLDPTYWVSGGYSVKLTGGSDGTKDAGVSGGVGPNPAARCGFEVRFSIGQMPEFIRLYLYRQGAVGVRRGRVRIDCVNSQLQCEDPTNTWNDVGECRLYANDTIFNSFKFVIDTATAKYVRAMVNDVEYDLSSYSCATGTTTVQPRLVFEMRIFSNDGQNDIIYLDSFVVTIDEP